ncbi:Uncharacterized protein Rs2_21755 [Raphanus sativus]|nr:Uncharacterized protein Rs2_21755 [Raphanus sativus]
MFLFPFSSPHRLKGFRSRLQINGFFVKPKLLLCISKLDTHPGSTVFHLISVVVCWTLPCRFLEADGFAASMGSSLFTGLFVFYWRLRLDSGHRSSKVVMTKETGVAPTTWLCSSNSWIG